MGPKDWLLYRQLTCHALKEWWVLDVSGALVPGIQEPLACSSWGFHLESCCKPANMGFNICTDAVTFKATSWNIVGTTYLLSTACISSLDGHTSRRNTSRPSDRTWWWSISLSRSQHFELLPEAALFQSRYRPFLLWRKLSRREDWRGSLPWRWGESSPRNSCCQREHHSTPSHQTQLPR